MKYLKNLKISKKILLACSIFILLMIGLALQGFLATREASAGFQTFYADRFVPVIHLNQMMQNILQIRINMTQEVIAMQENNMKEVEERIAYSKRLSDANHKLWQDYMATYLTEEEKVLAKTFITEEEKNAAIRKEFAKQIESKNLKEAEKYLEEWKNQFEKTKSAMEKLINYQDNIGKELNEQQGKNYRQTLIIMFSLLFGGILAGILITFALSKGIASPITDASSRMKDIASGEGDLTKRVNIESKDEIGEMAGWMNQFIIKIQQIVSEIADRTEKVHGSTEILNEQSQSLSSNTEQISSQSINIASATTEMNQNLELVSSSMEEMSISISEVAKKSTEASGLAGTAEKRIRDSNEVIDKLSTEAKAIGEVIDSIVLIANQTNLLALNAAIEAAGAGEAGKGFAVVASEVKQLAKQAGEFSENIKERIHSIQGASNQVIDAMQQISDVVQRVNEISGSIAAAVEEQSIAAKEIAQNIVQTTVASGEITKNIEGISLGSKEGAKSAAKLSDLAGEMNDLSNKLYAVVNQFKVK